MHGRFARISLKMLVPLTLLAAGAVGIPTSSAQTKPTAPEVVRNESVLDPRLQNLAHPEPVAPAAARGRQPITSGPGAIVAGADGRYLVEIRVTDTAKATVDKLRARGRRRNVR